MFHKKTMREKLWSRDGIMVIIFSIMYLVGVVGHAWDKTFPLMLQLTPGILLILGMAAFSSVILEQRWKVLAWAAATYLVTLGLEILGVQTGLVFGAYEYGETLGTSVWGTPLVIGFNWVLVVLGAVLISNGIFSNRVLSTISAGIMSVFFDYILEPVAISSSFDYWQWAQGNIPLQNYLAWFIIATAAAAAFNYFRLRVDSLVPRAYFIIQLTFFVLLRLALGI